MLSYGCLGNEYGYHESHCSQIRRVSPQFTGALQELHIGMDESELLKQMHFEFLNVFVFTDEDCLHGIIVRKCCTMEHHSHYQAICDVHISANR